MDEDEIIEAVSKIYPEFKEWCHENGWVDTEHHIPSPEELTAWEIFKEQVRQEDLKEDIKKALNDIHREERLPYKPDD